MPIDLRAHAEAVLRAAFPNPEAIAARAVEKPADQRPLRVSGK